MKNNNLNVSLQFLQITTQNLHSLKPLVKEAELEGHNFVQRTILEWESGKNNFSKKGEILFGIFDSDLCVGIGGLNIDPYVNDESLGRVRHLFISKKYRRMGLATQLLKRIIETALHRQSFCRFVLRILRLRKIKRNQGNSSLFFEQENHI